MQQNSDDHKRNARIMKMIIEMGGYNFNFRIPTSSYNDDIETITMLLNMLAEKLSESYKNLYLVHSRQTYEHLTDIGFLLDNEFRIRYVTSSYKHFIDLKQSKMIGTHFMKLLDKESQELWHSTLSKTFKFPQKLELNLKAKKKLTQPLTFFINVLIPDKTGVNYLLTAVRTVNIREYFNNDPTTHDTIQYDYNGLLDLSNSVLKNEQDISIIKEIRAHIEQHIAEPLGSLKKLAHDFGTNEYKLKNGFKELYGITVFKFQKEERLNKAKLLVEATSIPFKSIAVMMGFKTLAHFSRSFKKRFGNTPREIRK